MAFAPSPTLLPPRSSRRLRGRRAVSTAARCMRSCGTGTTIILNGMRTEQAFAAAWRNQPKWVVSRSLKSVGPNARLVENDLEGAILELKAERDGEIRSLHGPDLAQSLTELGLIVSNLPAPRPAGARTRRRGGPGTKDEVQTLLHARPCGHHRRAGRGTLLKRHRLRSTSCNKHVLSTSCNGHEVRDRMARSQQRTVKSAPTRVAVGKRVLTRRGWHSR